MIREKIIKKTTFWVKEDFWGSVVIYFGWVDILAFVLALLGGLYYWVDLNPEFPRWNEFYTNILSQLIGIGIIVIIIGTADQILRTRFEKQRLILQMSSSYNHFTCEAVRQLRDKGWLYDGTLRKANLSHPNLKGADLANANLAEAVMYQAKLKGAALLGANLRKAAIFRTKLTDANLWRADLRQAMFWESDLTGAKLAGKKPGRAETLAGSVLPDGMKLSEAEWQIEFEDWCRQEGTHPG